MSGQQVGPVGIEGDVLGCGKKRQQYCTGAHGRDLGFGVKAREHPAQDGERELGDHQPTPASAKPALRPRFETVQQRGPDEFERIREARQRKEPDGLEVEPLDGQPGLQGA